MKKRLLGMPLEQTALMIAVGCLLWVLVNIAVRAAAAKSGKGKPVTVWKFVNGALACFFASFFLYVTLFSRARGTERMLSLIPFSKIRLMASSATVRWEKLMNVFAFIPLGLTSAGAIPDKKRKRYLLALVFASSVSLITELAQLIFALGYCELDDFIVNVFGTLCGVLVCVAADAAANKMIKKRDT